MSFPPGCKISHRYMSESSLQNDLPEPVGHQVEPSSSLFPLPNLYHTNATLFSYVLFLSRCLLFVYTSPVLSQWRHTYRQQSRRNYPSMTIFHGLLPAWACRAPYSNGRIPLVNLYSNTLHTRYMKEVWITKFETESNVESFSGRWSVQDEGAYIVWQWDGH